MILRLLSASTCLVSLVILCAWGADAGPGQQSVVQQSVVQQSVVQQSIEEPTYFQQQVVDYDAFEQVYVDPTFFEQSIEEPTYVDPTFDDPSIDTSTRPTPPPANPPVTRPTPPPANPPVTRPTSPPATPNCLLDAPLGASGAYSGPPLTTLFPGVDAPVSAEEQRLYDLLMAERTQRGLPVIPLSPALTVVARAHARDATANGHAIANTSCNLHSWSGAGPWSACCYTSDHAEAACMWNKPRQLTRYKGDGFEISAVGASNARGALGLWMASSGHRSVILNEGNWQRRQWEAIGIGIDGTYFNVWFGSCPDYTADY